MAEEQENHTFSEKYIYMFMDAEGRGLPVDASSVELTDMQMRHNAFEVEMTDAATEMLGITLPISDPGIVGIVEDTLKRIRSGESFKCKTMFPAAAIGVLWAWHIVGKLNWQWRAVKKDWWETIAIADSENKYVILPVQYMRRISDSSVEISKWPHDIIDDIAASRLPSSAPNRLLRLY
jgi:hypothetical protein